MDSIFGRKKRSTKGGSSELLTSSNQSGHSSAEVIGNSMNNNRYNISAPNGNPTLSAGNGHDVYRHRDPADEFAPSTRVSTTSQHRRIPSGNSSSMRSVRQTPTDYVKAAHEPQLHNTRYASSTAGSSSDVASVRYPTMTSEILNRMSISSAASASLGLGPGMRVPSHEGQHLMHGSPSLPRDASNSSGISRGSSNGLAPPLPAHASADGKAEFVMPRPNDTEIERMFAELMNKRDFLGLPGGSLSDEYKEAARKNMMNFPVHKKWMLVYNDKFTEFHAEKERERTRRTHQQGPQGNALGSPAPMVITRNSPEWYIKKFMDGSVTTKHIESLAVTLRTCAMGWVENFVDAKGTPVLASFLSGLHAKGSAKSDTDMALEYEVLKAFRSLFNSKAGANDALKQPKCVNSIVYSIISSHLATRKQAADILLFLCHWAIPAGHQLVLRGFDEIRTSLGDHGRFDAWFRVLEQTIDGRGQMGSRVGQSDEVRKMSLLGHQEASLNEYAINNMFLVNAILAPRIVSEYDVRVHLRNQMDASGLQRILIKLRAFKNPDLDRQLDEYEKGAEMDYENVVETFNRDVLTDMSDPVDVFKAIVGKVSGSRAYDFFLSALQHFLLINQDGENLVHYYQLIDSMVTAVVMDRKGSVEGSDMSSLLGVSVNNVLSRFADQDAMNATREELQKTKVELRQIEQEKSSLEQQVNETSEGLVGKLQGRITELESDLDVARGNASAMQRDMEELEQGYVDRIVALEVESRELYDMLKEAKGTADAIAGDGTSSSNRQQLVETLEKQMERNKTIRKLEANARKNVQIAQMTAGEQKDAVREREQRLSRKRLSRASLRQDPVAAAEAEEDETSSESSDLDPTSEAGKWKIQATLAAGMAKNADLQSRMTEAKETRRRKGSRSSSSKANDSISGMTAFAAPSSESTAAHSPPPPPPPPPPPMASNAPSTFLDEIRKRKGSGLRSTSSGSVPTVSDMAPPPPPPPPPVPPPPPGVQSSAFSSTSSSRPDSLNSSLAHGEGPPPPPPPPPPAGIMRTGTPISHNAGSVESTPAVNRDSMLNVRASVSSTLGPSGPQHAPPPPPSSYFAANMVMRKEVQDVAKQRMKQLQWDKLTPQHAQETIWGQSLMEEEQLSALLREQGLFEEMEEDFKAKQITKRPVQQVKDKMEFKTHLTLQTRQGIEMVLRRVKSSLTGAKHATPEEVAHHIVHCDEAVLDQSFLEELLRHYPESEVKGQLGEYRNASDEELRLLHPADRLVVLLMTVPHLKDKVKGLLYLTKYRESFDIIKEGATRVREGSEELMKATSFAKLLSLILMMGNFLNSSGMQGGAFGFKISSINKLVDTKASDGTTLLHFVERTISRCFPDTEAFLEELDKPSEACRVQLLDLKRDMAELKSGSLQHKKELDRFLDEAEDRLEDPYAKLMLPFLNDVQSELTRLSDQVQFCERVYHDALRYFGEGPDPKRRGFPAPQPMRTEDFFGIFREFQAAYRKVKVDNVQIAELRNAEAKRRAAAEERERERQEAIKRKEAGVDDSAVLETLLSNLRGGSATPKRKRKTQPRGTRENGRQSIPGGTEDATQETMGNASSGMPAAVPSIDGNPSDVAQAMLAKLQGGDGGLLGAQGESRTSGSYVNRRRRERRGTQGASANSGNIRDEATGSMQEFGAGTGGVGSGFGAEEADLLVAAGGSDVQLAESINGPAPGRPPRRSQVSESATEMERAESDSGRSSSVYSAQDEGEEDDVVGAELAPAAERMMRMDSDDFRQSITDAAADKDAAAMRRDLAGNSSGEFVIDQGEWFDPDGSGFMNTSTNSADRTARP